MSKNQRIDQSTLDSFKSVLRKTFSPDRNEILDLLKDIERYPIIKLDNVVEKIDTERTYRVDGEGGDEIGRIKDIGRTCVLHPFFPKSVYYYKIPLEKENIQVSFFIDLSKRSGKVLFKYNKKGAPLNANAGIIPLLIKVDMDDPEKRIYLDIDNELVNRKMSANSIYTISLGLISIISAEYGVNMDKIIGAISNIVFLLLGDLHINNYYPFESGVNKRGEGGEVIFLNKFPHKAATHSETLETEDKRAPHQRRGTWWTMRADRYKTHPNYLKECANYRQASWIGPKEFKMKGKTYKIVLPKDESLIIAE